MSLKIFRQFKDNCVLPIVEKMKIKKKELMCVPMYTRSTTQVIPRYLDFGRRLKLVAWYSESLKGN